MTMQMMGVGNEPTEAAKPAANVRRRPRPKRLRVAMFVLAVLVVLLARPATHHARAASLLMTFSDPAAKPEVADERISFTRPDGEVVPARLYVPRGVSDPPGVVLVHGVHHRGIDEPRLERFARAVANQGVVVMTPAVKELSDYKVAPRSVDTTGAAVDALRARLGKDKVGLMGMSFGGGISLLAAADPRFAEKITFVVAVGAHDDLSRVSRFFVTNEVPEPDGSVRQLRAHGYGMMVLVYSHAADFFPPYDVPAAEEALKAWLMEERDRARAAAERLSPPSKAKLDVLFASEPPRAGTEALARELLAEIASHTSEMSAVSPHGHLDGIRANVYLLHGASDTVIPSTETLWLAKDVPPTRLRQALVSPAIEHVELRSPSAADQWALVHFMGEVIGETR